MVKQDTKFYRDENTVEEFFDGDFAGGKENKKRFKNNRTNFNAGTRLD